MLSFYPQLSDTEVMQLRIRMRNHSCGQRYTRLDVSLALLAHYQAGLLGCMEL